MSSPVEVKPYGAVRRPSVIFSIPNETDRSEAQGIADVIRERLPDINFAVVSESIQITHVN